MILKLGRLGETLFLHIILRAERHDKNPPQQLFLAGDLTSKLGCASGPVMPFHAVIGSLATSSQNVTFN